MGGIPPSVRRRRSQSPAGDLSGLVKCLQGLQGKVEVAQAQGAVIKPAPRNDGLGSTAKPFRVHGGRKDEGASREPPLEPYSLNSWATEEAFVVNVEGVADPPKVSFSLQGDILEIRDPREGVSPANSFQEVIIPEEFEPRLDPSLRKYWKDLRVVELRFERKDRSS